MSASDESGLECQLRALRMVENAHKNITGKLRHAEYVRLTTLDLEEYAGDPQKLASWLARLGALSVQALVETSDHLTPESAFALLRRLMLKFDEDDSGPAAVT